MHIAAVLVALAGGPRLMGATDRLHVGLGHAGLHTGVLREIKWKFWGKNVVGVSYVAAAARVLPG